MPKLNPEQNFPSMRSIKDPDTRKYVEKLHAFLDELIRNIALADDICQVQEIELIKSGNRAGDDGNLKLSFDGTNVLEQFKVSGSWTTKRTLVPPS